MNMKMVSGFLIAVGVAACGSGLEADVAVDAEGAVQDELRAYVPQNDLERHVAVFARRDGVITQNSIYEGSIRMNIDPCTSDFLVHAFLDPFLCTGGLKVSESLSKIRGSQGLDVWDAQGNVDNVTFNALFSANGVDTNQDGAVTFNELVTYVVTLYPNDPAQQGRLIFGFNLLFINGSHDRWVTEGGKEVKAISRHNLKGFYNGRLFPELPVYTGQIPPRSSISCENAGLPPLPPPPVCE